jgi:hypothetical protein
MPLKDLRYNIMLALYFPILLYAFSTFDLQDDVFVVEGLEPVVVAPETVIFGEDFQARTFLAVREGGGQSLTPDDPLVADGNDLLRMSTIGSLEDDQNEAEVSYSAEMAFPQVGGGIARMPVEGTFRVRRPEIVAQSEATAALYRQSRNQIRIDVPGLEERELRLSVDGRSVDGRSVTVSPSGNQVTVRVSLADGENDVFLGTKSFSVIDPPRPELRVLSAGREVRSGDNLPRARAMLSFEVVPDEQFRSRFPQDARYAVSRARVHLNQGMQASREIGVFSLDGGQLVLTSALRDARPGDRVTVVLEGISRINHAGQAIPVPFQRGSLTFAFTLS